MESQGCTCKSVFLLIVSVADGSPIAEDLRNWKEFGGITDINPYRTIYAIVHPSNILFIFFINLKLNISNLESILYVFCKYKFLYFFICLIVKYGHNCFYEPIFSQPPHQVSFSYHR